MEIIVDATNKNDIYTFNNPTRGCGKTFLRIEWYLAFIQSKLTGKQVKYEVGKYFNS